ncbi:unnamed protein product, partial [Staurois parvus]
IFQFQPVITCQHPAIAEYLRRGRNLCINNTAVCLQWKALTQHIVKQHTVNPLIAPDVNHFLPSAISTGSVLFISTDHCIGITGDVSDTKSVSECPLQFC